MAGDDYDSDDSYLKDSDAESSDEVEVKTVLTTTEDPEFRSKVLEYKDAKRKPLNYGKTKASVYKKGEEVWVCNKSSGKVVMEGPFIVEQELGKEKYKLKNKADGKLYAKEVAGEDIRVKT